MRVTHGSTRSLPTAASDVVRRHERRAARTTLMQHHSTDAQRGRIFAQLFGVSSLSLAVGAVCAGFLGESVGIIPVLAVQGGGYVLAGVMVVALLAPAASPAEEVIAERVPEPVPPH